MKSPFPGFPSRPLGPLALAAAVGLGLGAAFSPQSAAAPNTILISLDGATPRLLEKYLTNGVLNPAEGLGLLRSQGVYARQNRTISPSLTAAGHIAIATGSTAARNDIPGNTFHLLNSPFASTISGFGAPIGGYDHHLPGESASPTAEPIWAALRAAGKKVVAATFAGADGVDVRIPGLINGPIIQPAAERTVDYTVPFGAFAGAGAQGFTLTAAGFADAPAEVSVQLAAAGRSSFSPVKIKTGGLETLKIGGTTNLVQMVAIDSSNDSSVNYDTLVFYSDADGIKPGPFTLPSTGPAYVKLGADNSASFYVEGSSSKAGARYYATQLAPDLSALRVARTSFNSIPRNTAVLADVDDVNKNVGFWAPQPDFRIPERLSPGFTTFPDAELEAIYENTVETFTEYQTRLALHAIRKNPDADLVMIYFEQPDGSSHQFLLTDPRQPTDYTNPNSIGAGQDAQKAARYATYVEKAYQVVNRAVQKIIDEVGLDSGGRPKGNIIVTSDHGFEAFHTAVDMNRLMTNAGFTNTQVRAVTTGPAVNIYINLAGRESGGTISREEYVLLQKKAVGVLQAAMDTNLTYTLGSNSVPLFHKIYSRPVSSDLSSSEFGLETSEFIGQDSGDVYALLTPGYNFDGTQNPVVIRKDDPASATPVLSVPNFYGAHGYDPLLPNMSAIFVAAGPNMGRGEIRVAHNIDIAPTIEKILGVTPAETVQGSPLLQASLGVASRATLPNGISSGDVKATSVVLWARSAVLGPIAFRVGTNSSLGAGSLSFAATVTDTNLPVKQLVTGLTDFTQYYYSATDAAGATLAGRFRTLAGPGRNEGVRFGVAGDWRGELAPYPAIANASTRNLDFFVKFGDTIYADYPSPAVNKSQAKTLAEYRAKHAEVYADRYGANTFADLQSTTPVFSLIDDHEVTDDFAGGAAPATDPRFDKTGNFINETALFKTGLQAFHEYNAIVEETYDTPAAPLTHQKPKLYRARRLGVDAAMFLLDTRSFRHQELAAPASLGAADVGAYLARSFDIDPANGKPLPQRTMLGTAQLADLMDDLRAAQRDGVTWKFILVPEPLQNLGVLASSDRYEGYARERTQLLQFIQDNGIQNVVFISADIHGTLVNNLTYQLGPGLPQIPTDMFEITTGSVAFDAPFGPTVLDLAADVEIAPGATLLQSLLNSLKLPNRAAFDALLTRDQKDAAIEGLVNSQVTALGYDPLGLQNSPVRATLLEGHYTSTFTYGWSEFEVEPQSQVLTVTTYGIDYYDKAGALPAMLDRAPEVVSRFTVNPAPPTVHAAVVGGQVVITWPSTATRHILQIADSLGAPTEWHDISAVRQQDWSVFFVKLPPSSKQQFFRLYRAGQ